MRPAIPQRTWQRAKSIIDHTIAYVARTIVWCLDRSDGDGKLTIQKPAPQLRPAPRFHRDAWLESALEVLAHKGQAKLRIDTLAEELGVTKGSFYHHFKNREDFIQSLIAYWASAFTDWVINQLESLNLPAEERLLRLMQFIERERLDRYDMAFRSWAAQDPSVAEAIKKVDLVRYGYVKSIFVEMGFEGLELEERVRIWLVLHSAQQTVFTPDSEGAKSDAIAMRHAFFTRSRESDGEQESEPSGSRRTGRKTRER